MPPCSARRLDAKDELARFRSRFYFADANCIYLDGNSLGRMPIAVGDCVKNLIEGQWGDGLVRSWEDWFGMPMRIGRKISRVIGARENEVVVSDSTTVNLFKLVYAALARDQSKKCVVTDDLNFPSDVYAISGVVEALGYGRELRTLRSSDSVTIEENQIAQALDGTALLTLSHVSFKSGFLYDMKRITDLAHQRGVPVLWDLSHSAGVVPVDLCDSGVDFAVGCTYKYLNGGPGAPAFLYVRRDWQERLSSPIQGWFGRRQAFDFGLEYLPKEGIERFLVGTPPVLSLAATEPGIDITLEAGVNAIRAKSIQATEYLITLWDRHLREIGVALKSPREAERRGSHVSFGHPKALEIDQALIHEHNVVPDFRAPDNIRFGVSPLYTTFAEIEEAVLRFKEVIVTKSYERFSGRKPAVT